LDKKSAAVDALKDYASMKYIIQNHHCELEEAMERMTSLPSSLPDGRPRAKNLKAGEARLAASLDEIDVLKERYRRALEYMEWFQPSWDALTEDEQFVLSEFYCGGDVRQTDGREYLRAVPYRAFIRLQQKEQGASPAGAFAVRQMSNFADDLCI
jgi:hypothetical protein